MTVTAAQATQNLRSAERLAAISLGIDAQNGAPLTSLTYEQRTAYVRALAAIIAGKPAQFSPGAVETANAVLAKSYQPLEDTAFDWDQFATLATDNALEIGASVAAVGEGVKNGLNLTRYLIPLAVVAAFYVGYLSLRKRAAV